MTSNMMVKYEVNGSEITLTQDDVKKYLVSGDADKVTDKEFKLFMELCKAQRLNPFLKEAYLIKFGNDANIIVGKDVFLKRARANESFRGFKAGIIVATQKGFEKREGTFYLKGREEIVGGWADVYIKDWEVPFEHSVSLAEFNNGTATWKSMPAVMIRKVALVQALREAFPDELQQLYSSEEMQSEDIIDEDSVQVSRFIDDSQRRELFDVAKGNDGAVKTVLDNYGYKSSSEILRQDFEDVKRKVIEVNKEMENEVNKKLAEESK